MVRLQQRRRERGRVRQRVLPGRERNLLRRKLRGGYPLRSELARHSLPLRRHHVPGLLLHRGVLPDTIRPSLADLRGLHRGAGARRLRSSLRYGSGRAVLDLRAQRGRAGVLRERASRAVLRDGRLDHRVPGELRRLLPRPNQRELRVVPPWRSRSTVWKRGRRLRHVRGWTTLRQSRLRRDLKRNPVWRPASLSPPLLPGPEACAILRSA
jgi:hypothetical protein